MNPESIKTRISIGKKQQGDIAFLYDFNLLKELNIPADSYFTNSFFLKIGTEIEFNGQKYKIQEIQTIFYNETVDMSNPPGFNLYGYGELLDYNFEIAYFVESI